MTVWFSSDWHLCHENVIKYSRRPFGSVEEMNGALVSNWNERVKPGDCGYILGDFTLSKDPEVAAGFSRRMNGQKFLITGNHDRWAEKVKEPAKFGFVWIRPYHELKVGDQKIILCHYPFLTWNGSHRGSWNIFGHSHGTSRNDIGGKRLDAGVDCWNYYPVSFDEVKAFMDKRSFVPTDHHGAEAVDE